MKWHLVILSIVVKINYRFRASASVLMEELHESLSPKEKKRLEKLLNVLTPEAKKKIE
jgi:Spy/CpxP family protein refolding chaperone